MDYEKKYKEMKARVLEIGRGYVKGVDFSKPRQIAEYIDPKLGESGDEEIRQLLVRFVTYDMSDNYSDDISKEECLAWLEKQNEQKHISDFSTLRTWKYVVDAVLTEKEGIGQYLDSPFTEELAKKLQERFGNIEQVPKDSYVFNSLPRLLELIVPIDKAKAYCQKLIDSLQQEGYVVDAEIVGECLKQINGEKVAMAAMDEKPVEEYEPATVEPMFHEGDWVACNSDNLHSPLRVVSVSDTEYKVEDPQGVLGRPKIEYMDKHYHRWTIQDAKDGEVLAEDSCTFIIKKLNQDDSAEIYCCLFDDGDFETNCSLSFAETSTYPATKEQCDILFQKMNEAGYEWDAERKELCPLSKSEDACKPVVEHTLEDAAKAFLQALSGTPYNNTPIVEAQIITKQLLTFLSDPKAYDPDAINEHKSAEWSEEDEAMFQGVIETEQYMLDVVYGRKIFAVGNEDIKEECTKELSWLKSLKDRIK